MKASKRSGEGESAPRIGKKEYARELRRLQIELVKLHRHVIAHGGKLLVIREERDEFLDSAPRFERMLVRSGISLLKYYLDISREEQARRLRARRRDPLKQWKISPVDEAAQRHWRDYSRARDSMLLRTHQQHAPWILVRADDKHQARLNVIRDILARIPFASAKRKLARPDPRVAREFSETLLGSGWVAP